MTNARPAPSPTPSAPPAADSTEPGIPAAERRRRARIERWSRPLATRGDRLRAWIDMLLADNGIVRLAYPNLHRVADGVWRSGQPTPGRLRAFARRGGRAVVSLRAGRGFGSLPLELEACRDAGLSFHNLPLRARTLPSRDDIRAAVRLFEAVERPVLLHCQSGADRAGFAAALYLMLAENRPVAEACRQLALGYGHLRLGRAGVLDAFFDAYARDTATGPMPLAEWVETCYDPERIAAGFGATPLTTRITGRRPGRG